MPMQKHILIVDDDDGVRSTIGELLEEQGYRVSLAHDGRAMRNVLSDGHSIDAIILDFFLPGESGGNLALYAETLKLPVILMTGGLAGREFARAQHIQLLKKPFRSDQLLAAIARAVETCVG